MNYLLDLFFNWLFEKSLDSFIAVVIFLAFNPKRSTPITFKINGVSGYKDAICNLLATCKI
ncbi:hypothetical protein [Bacillus mojavensis]|uniref:hypothetical protein n=1 Tax=Bacillus mojavensis TaxID=72360 RepID=UPI0039A562D3